MKNIKNRKDEVERHSGAPRHPEMGQYPEYVPCGHELGVLAEHWYEAVLDYQWRSMAYPNALHPAEFYEKRIERIRELIGDDEVARANLAGARRELVRYFGQQIIGHPADGEPDLEGGPMFCLENVVRAALDIQMRVPPDSKSREAG
jgi:hypothetical protein